jgi:hypothetical protein
VVTAASTEAAARILNDDPVVMGEATRAVASSREMPDTLAERAF